MENVRINTKAVVSSLQIKKTSVRWKTVIPILLLVWIVNMLDKIGVGIIATNKTFLIDMHLTNNPALVGTLVSALLFSYGIGFFFWGPLVDKFGAKRCGCIALFLWGLSTGIAALAPNFTVLLISRIILGVSEAALWPLSNSLTARWFPLSERGRAKSFWINGTIIGPAISGFVIDFLLEIFNWRGVFWSLTFLAIVVCLPLFGFILKESPTDDKRVSPEELHYIESDQLTYPSSNNSSNNGVLKSLSFWMVVLTNTATLFAFFGLATWFPSYLSIAKHFSRQATSYYMLLAYGISIFVVIYTGRQIDKTRKKAIWGLRSFWGIATCFILAALIDSVMVDVLLVCLAIVMVNITTLISHGITHSLSVTNRIGRENALMMGIASILSAFGPTIMGALIKVGNGTYLYSFMFLVVVSILASGCFIVLKRRGY
ncbi:MFS transporter [Effusibacillus dendaii]|uniref:MFS transporter n=1 Tax=Effusibacillus dendaii TaxID=2743772 RepID=A0A7I8DBP2_9BACL|nr:MFS transporter [Effusibacillus dendaii]BCJ86256.1 MFS transporter [Effusibacillus dendaii]